MTDNNNVFFLQSYQLYARSSLKGDGAQILVIFVSSVSLNEESSP